MRLRDPLGTAATTVWAAGNLIAVTLLGATVYEQVTASPGTTAAAPDTPLDQPDPAPPTGAA